MNKSKLLTLILIIQSFSMFSQGNGSLSYQAAQMLMMGFQGTDLSQNEHIVSDVNSKGKKSVDVINTSKI